MAGKEDEVMIGEDVTEAVDIELDEEEDDGDTVVVGDGKDDKAAKTDAAPKTTSTKQVESDGEEEARERKRAERKERNDRRKEARDRNIAELAELREQVAEVPELKKKLEALQKQTTTSEAGALLSKARQDLQIVNSVIAKATEDGNGSKVIEGLDLRDRINGRIAQLEHFTGSQQRTETTQTRAQPQEHQGSKVNPAIVDHYSKFAKDHDWYQASNDTSDLDSQLVKTIDRAITAEGYDPTTQDYWDELRERIAEKLPHRAKAMTTTQGGKQPAARGGPQVGSGRSQVMPGRQTYTLSAEHLNAIRDAGKDPTDPAVLKHYAKIYQKYDRENATA